jgi:hypothetical protein
MESWRGKRWVACNCRSRANDAMQLPAFRVRAYLFRMIELSFIPIRMEKAIADIITRPALILHIETRL